MKTLENTQSFVRAYEDDERDAWEAVRLDHDWAMLAFEIEALLDLGIVVNRQMRRVLEHWHDWVAEDSSRYLPATHELLHSEGQRLIEINQRVVQLVEKVQKRGHKLRRFDEFQEIEKNLRSDLGSCSGAVNDEFAVLHNTAIADFEANRTVEIANWGE